MKPLSVKQKLPGSWTSHDTWHGKKSTNMLSPKADSTQRPHLHRRLEIHSRFSLSPVCRLALHVLGGQTDGAEPRMRLAAALEVRELLDSQPMMQCSTCRKESRSSHLQGPSIQGGRAIIRQDCRLPAQF